MTFRDVRMRGFHSRADVDEVLRWIDAWPAPLGAEEVPLGASAGRVLADDVVSGVDVPAFARSSMDGWALRGSDTFGATESEPLMLGLCGESRPGEAPPGRLAPGTAMRIRTGAPLPEGADAVLPAESGAEEEAPHGDAPGRRTLAVRGEVPPGRHVGQRGEDVPRGSVALARGRRLRPQDVALLSSLGCARVSAVQRPEVALLITGSELLPAGSRPTDFSIPDANGPLLEALVARDGGVPLARGIFRDDDPGLAEELTAARADVLLVTGASSVGPEDRVPELVARLGTLHFHGVALRPASPAGLGTVGARPVFLLPGNPVSALCAYDLFAGRLVRRLAGRSPELPYRSVHLPLARKVVSELGRVDVLRVRISAGRVEPLTARGAGVLSTTTRADGFVLVGKNVEGWQEGTTVEVYLYDGA